MAKILDEIYEGWKNYIFENPDVEQEAKRRMEICVDCDHFEKHVKICKKCKCFMPVKVRVPLVNCPIGEWEAMEIKKGES